MTTESDDEKRQTEVLAEIKQLGIRYPSTSNEPPPKDLDEAIEQEKRALEIRYAPVLNRKVGEIPGPPTLSVIDGGRPSNDEPQLSEENPPKDADQT